MSLARHLILDTNVFYDLGMGTLDLSTVRSADDALDYSPLTVLELAGKWSERTFSERRAAANAILTSGANELPDQDTYLTRSIFGYVPKRPAIQLTDAVKAMAGSPDIRSLESGVQDFAEMVIRKVRVPRVARWRAAVEGQWVKEMTVIQEREIPRFQTWNRADSKTRKQQVPHLTGEMKQAFLRNTRNPNWGLTLIINCHKRALLGASKIQSDVPTSDAVKTISSALSALECYCGVYTQYLIRLLVDGALPEENDSGDLELFLYAADDQHVVVTSEKKWKRMAEKAGFGNRVRLIG
jgi:hypothetical protein